MTQDYTRIGQRPAVKTPLPLADRQRYVLRAIYANAAVFLAAGIWLVSGGTTPFPEESTSLIGYSFIFVAVLDGLLAALLKRFWEKSGKL
jgi:hypothetical protein